MKNQRFFTFYLGSIASAACDMQGYSVKNFRNNIKDTGKIYIMVDDVAEGKALGIEPWIDVNDKGMRMVLC